MRPTISLYDNIQELDPTIAGDVVRGLCNRGDHGTGHGWASAHSVAWAHDLGGGPGRGTSANSPSATASREAPEGVMNRSVVAITCMCLAACAPEPGGASATDGATGAQSSTGGEPGSSAETAAPTTGDVATTTTGTTAAASSAGSVTEATTEATTDGPPEIPANPFGGHLFQYAEGAILPGFDPADLDDATAAAYDAWKADYLAAICGDGRWVVEAKIDANNLTVSEAHGYGMMVSAIMAGHDPDAQAQFDGLYRYFRDHPSANSPDLMAWYQDGACADAMGQDSASDGDIDIAFALLLADRQWGSCGEIDYRAEALAVIAAIGEHELDAGRAWVLLGDWAAPGDAMFYQATRSSDFITDHFRSFGEVTGDPSWAGLADSVYGIVDAIQTEHSPATGLLPDFIVAPGSAPKPAPAGFLEGPNDGAYDYNACRDPWRLATDFLVSGDPRPRAEVQAMTAWITAVTGGDPMKIRAGYQLDGTPSKGSNYLTMAFVAPFGPAAMVDAANQAWLDALWQTTADAAPEGYYEDSIRLLAMIVMSGNWWDPAARPAVCNP